MIFYRPLSPVKAITFDLDDTLYDNGPIIRAAEEALDLHLETHHPQTAELQRQDWLKIKKKLISDNPALASDMGELRMQSLLTALADELPSDQLEDAARACFDLFYHKRSDFELDKNIHSCLQKLSKIVPLVAITNGNVDPEQIGIADYFQHFFHANVSLPMKPAPALFEAAIVHLGIRAGEILHVGDNLVKDIQGALDAGMQTAWYAHNRGMIMREEKATLLPHVELANLDELLFLVN